jgi:transposase InsO family protein
MHTTTREPESFVDSFKTELIADRVWRSRSQLELATVEYIGWFNTARLHSTLGLPDPSRIRSAILHDQGSSVAGSGRPGPAAELPALAGGLSDG